ncbi:GerMN domain-containing protein [Marinilactibacillus piezotolerans]|uniref:GerMN domain-containing protein n=1 Tax=Marinilactibacillus piezotolerans TaxID=258723 RepID=UPI0009AF2DF6|nr:GerMN domain-containing protein [Marinilactibacillus piezotolerans]
MSYQSMFKKMAFLSLSGLVLAACSDEAQPTTEDTTEQTDSAAGTDTDTNTDSSTDEETTENLSQNMLDWIPMNENTRYVYEGEGAESAAYTVYPQFTHSDTLQVVQSGTGTDSVKVYEYAENEVREVFLRGETYFRDDVVDTGLTSEQDQYEVLLQAPIEVGHSWESPSGSISEITDSNVSIETPAGTYDALEITRTLNDTTTLLYYAPAVGMIQSIYEPDGDMTVTSTLSQLEDEVPEEIPLTVYELNEMATALNTVETTLELYTNDPARLALTEILNGSTDVMSVPSLTENVELNYLYMGNDGIVHADFSEELITEMNAGSGIEALLLQSIVNTIGGYYQTDEVLVTVETEPYESGHIAMDEGQTMQVDLSSVEE